MTSTADNKILVTYPEPWIAQVTLNIPKKYNAMTMELYRDLGAILRDIAVKDEILVTILTGNGVFFSAGADFGTLMGTQEDETERNFWYRKFAANNLDVTRAFYQHPKILITALNGPTIGLSAAIIAHSDFIYCTKSAYLFTPFTSLGLTAEGGASATLVHRLGLAKANEALLLSKKITSEELLSTGFINGIYPDEKDSSVFHGKIIALTKELFGDHLNRESILKTKQIVRAQFMETLDKQNLLEVYAGLERFVKGAPQGEFMKLASGQKKHKL